MRSSKRNISIYTIAIHTFLLVLSALFVIPLGAIVSISISSETDIIANGFKLIPSVIDFTAYAYIFENPKTILMAYKVTIITSVAGLVLYLIMASMIAFALSRTDFYFRKVISFYLFFTMLFNGGLVPFYILINQYLHLRDTYAALIIPLLGNIWYIFIIRTSFQQIPSAIIDSAKIDGAGEFQIFVRMILPLSKPVLATIGLLQLLSNWNSWFPALLFVDNSDLYPLQYMLQTILRNVQELTQNMDNKPAYLFVSQQIPTESMRMAMAIVAIGPMMFVFPFFQKYFVKGLTVGSVKG
ncbi:ABC transporter permease subunit [Paenibacillus sp. LMG 31461]|uniref:ABC transporter permease subunit n=1 Tax=Paenibacillus plantarum TaxID=2654975 RepID=A0ABX1XDV1_9BACL|nr:carbohydrate ABC transporter permease [Paenibacillus plantarum]NOU66080.1 ABC transporter permease subunit [Paenibacillus plantarum]